MKYSSLYIVTFLSFSGYSVFAQNQEENALPTQQINVVKPYQPTLSDAFKINGVPAGDTSVYEAPDLNYKLKQSSMEPAIKLDPVKPFKVKDEAIAKLYRLYAKAGFGNYTTPLADLYFNSLRSSSYQTGLHLGYLASNGTIADAKKVQTSNINGQAYYNKYWTGEELDLSASFAQKKYSLYGNFSDSLINLLEPSFNTTAWDPANPQFRTYNDLRATATLKSRSNDINRIEHSGTVSIINFQSKELKETGFLGYGYAAKQFDFAQVGVDVLLDATQNAQMVNKSFNRNLFGVKPFIKLKGEKYTVLAGINTQFEIADSNAYHFYPSIDAQFTLAPKILVAYAKLDGAVSKNNLRDIASINPYLYNAPLLRSTNTQMLVEAGLRGNISSELWYRLGLSYAKQQNALFFVNTPFVKDNNTFVPIYDDLKTFSVQAEVAYHVSEKLNMEALLVYNNYTTSKLAKAWQKSPFNINLLGRYNLADKVMARAAIYYVASRQAAIYSSANSSFETSSLSLVEEKTLKSFIDANLGFEYRYSKQFSLFLNFNNLLAQRYQLWNGYNSQGLQVLGGLTFAF